MSKSILLACPTRGHIWWETAMRFAELREDVNDFLILQNSRSVLEARNEIMSAFLESGHDYLLTIDDDIIPADGIVQALRSIFASKKNVGIAAAPCALIRPGLPVLPNLYKIDLENSYFALDMKTVFDPERPRLYHADAVGFGAVMISRALAQEHPLFFNRQNEEGVYLGEDVDYCIRAKLAGYNIVCDLEMMSDHLVHVHAGGLARTFSSLLEKVLEIEDSVEPSIEVEGSARG